MKGVIQLRNYPLCMRANDMYMITGPRADPEEILKALVSKFRIMRGYALVFSKLRRGVLPHV